MTRAAVGFYAVTLLAAACDGGGGTATAQAGVLEGDPRYRIEYEARPPASRGSAGELRLSVQPLADWHLAPQAPAKLFLEDGDGVRFEAAARDDATGPPESALAFTSDFHCDEPGTRVARGRIKFGMCQGDSERCYIVERDLELPLEVAPAD
jgi:hypothetical protein